MSKQRILFATLLLLGVLVAILIWEMDEVSFAYEPVNLGAESF